jgi:hypothetical protein
MPAISLAFMSEPEASLNLCASVPLWFTPRPKLTKTERKGRGAEKSTVVHQQLTTTKTDRPVSFRFQVRRYDRNLDLSALICSNLRRSALFSFGVQRHVQLCCKKLRFLDLIAAGCTKLRLLHQKNICRSSNIFGVVWSYLGMCGPKNKNVAQNGSRTKFSAVDPPVRPAHRFTVHHSTI